MGVFQYVSTSSMGSLAAAAGEYTVEHLQRVRLRVRMRRTGEQMMSTGRTDYFGVGLFLRRKPVRLDIAQGY